MKILNINIKEDSLFNDLEINLAKNDENFSDTIILAGENGSGKTTLLEMIYETLSLEFYSQKNIKYDGFFSLMIHLNDEEIRQINDILTKSYNTDIEITDIIKVGRDFKKFGVWEQFIIEYYKEDKWINIEPSWFVNAPDVKDLFNTMYSTVDVNYVPEQINSVTTLEIDQKISFSNKSGKNLATEIHQLLVDIITTDAIELSEWVSSNKGKVPIEEVTNKRLNRFNNAFSKIFTNFQIKKVKNINNSKEVIAEKNGKEVYISNLSSGEKQIIFRGAFLLRNLSSYANGIILIDEPEISLHPVWQQKILEYYKSLFRDESGQITSQIVISTHSPFIIHNHNVFEDKVVILKNTGDNIIIEKNPTFPSIGSSELINEAFNVNIFKKQKPMIFVEGETDQKYISKYLQLTDRYSLVDVEWIGYYDQTRKAKFTGESALNKLLELLMANKKVIESPVVILYDSDTNKGDKDYSNFFMRTMPFNSENKIYKKGIENVLTLPSNFNFSEFYKTKTITDSYGAVNTVQTLDKVKLCDTICTSEHFKDYAEKLGNYIDKIIEVFGY